MVLAADYPFLDILGTMLIFFAWVIWFWILIRVLVDVFRRHDISGFGKAAWTLFMIVVPFLGVLIYLIAHGQEMGQRDLEQAKANRAQFDDYVKSVAGDGSGGAAAEIAKAKSLLDSGAITQEEFNALKAKALAPSG
jgi:Short C-terminal domain/Phospholipase_D-nuclease N-terminal